MFQVPRVSGHTIGRSLCGTAHGKFIHICLSDDDHACFFQAVNDIGIILRDKSLQNFRSAGGLFSLDTDVILYSNGNTGQRTCIGSVRNAFFHLFCPCIGFFFIGVQVRMYLSLFFLNLVKYGLYAVQDTNLMLFYLFRQLEGGHFFQIHGPVSYPIVFGT